LAIYFKTINNFKIMKINAHASSPLL